MKMKKGLTTGQTGRMISRKVKIVTLYGCGEQNV